mgnify:CR=1 FL=1
MLKIADQEQKGAIPEEDRPYETGQEPENKRFAQLLEQSQGFGRSLQLKLICLLLLVGAFIHLLIIVGIMSEEGIPLFFTVYFHSLLVMNVVCAFGLWYYQRWGWYLVILIALSQIFSHMYLLVFYFQVNQVIDRIVDIVLVTYLLYYFNKDDVKSRYFKPLKDVFYIRR